MGIDLSETFLAKTRQIASVYEDQQLVVNALIRMMRKTMKKIQSIYVKDLLYTLYEKNMGTADVINLSNRLMSGNKHRRDEIVRMTMQTKIRDAWGSLRKERHEEQVMWREVRRKLQEQHKVMIFNFIWAEERGKQFKKLREKRKRKIEWIKNKYYKKDRVPDVYKGVIVRDQDLGESFKTEPIVFGGTETNDAERSILRVHPKFTVFDKVDKVDCEAEIEKSLTKLRWNRIQEESEKTRIENGVQEIQKKDTYNIEERTFDFRQARSTELPFNVRTTLRN